MNAGGITRGMVLLGLIAVGLAGRLIPHPPNFAPIIATVLFAGFFFRHRAVGLLVALVVMAVSDTVIGRYDPRMMAVVYASLLLPVAPGPLLRNRLTGLRVGGCAAACSIVFFLTTNFAVWACGSLYPKTVPGLIACYTAALPFLQNALAGDLLWSAALFGSYALAARALLTRRVAVAKLARV